MGFSHFSEVTLGELVLRAYLEHFKNLVPLAKHRLFKAREEADDSMTTNNKRRGNKTIKRNFKDVLQS